MELREALKDPERYARSTAKVRKEERDTPEKLNRDLTELLLMFGLRAAADSATRVAGAPIIHPSIFRDALENKPVKIKWFWEMKDGIVQRVEDITEETRNKARESVKSIIRESLSEYPRPGPAEVARRIRTQFEGPGEVERPHRTHATEGERAFVFSSERAAIIARTELVQAENTGIVEGYRATGIKEIEWLAYSDGRSGDRHHERMNGKRIKLGEYFTTPRGNKLRYPGDPFGPIADTIQCRCTVKPVTTGPAAPTAEDYEARIRSLERQIAQTEAETRAIDRTLAREDRARDRTTPRPKRPRRK